MLHAPLARFANTCMHEFCAFAYKIALFLPFAFPENVLHSILPFVLCFFIFFCKRNCVMIGAGFVLVEITAFCAVLSRVLCTIVCWLICFLAWFLPLHVQFFCCLIFCSTFVHCLCDFSGPIPHFCIFCLSHDFLVVPWWFSAISLIIFCLLLQSELLTYILLATATCFVVIVKFFIIFFSG